MIEFRRFNQQDAHVVADFALAALEKVAERDDVPLNVSARKVAMCVDMFVYGARHFQMAAFEDRRCVAAIALYVDEIPFFERCEGHVFFWFSTSQGAGMRLASAMMDWVGQSPMIRRVQWTMNEGDARLKRVIARRFGFQREVSSLVYYKGG